MAPIRRRRAVGLGIACAARQSQRLVSAPWPLRLSGVWCESSPPQRHVAVNAQGGERIHTTTLVDPAGERRKERRARRKASQRLSAAIRAATTESDRAEVEAQRADLRATAYLPAAGESRPAALRTPGRLRIPRHQDTSATLAGAYPFLAEGGLGSQGVFVGQDLYSGASFVYDPWVLYSRGMITAPNIVLAGIVGSGKSSLVKSLYTRSIPFGRRVYVPGDPKGEHTAVAEAVGGQAIVLGHGMANRLNPLDEGHRPSGVSDESWAGQVASRRRDLIGALTETVLERPLSPLEHTAIDLALADTVRSCETPILPMIVERILSPDASQRADRRLVEDGRVVGHALRRLVAGDLAGLFDGPSTVTFDPTLPMISLDLSRVAENTTLVSVLMTCSSAWMESALLDPHGGQRWVIYDEAWRLMSHPALLRRMDAQWRLARHYGIANLLVFHKLSDLDNVGDQGSAMRAIASSLLANAETRIIYRQESDQLGATATALGLTGTEQSLLPGLATGQGLWRIKDRSFVVQHQLHPAELAAFDTTSRMTEEPRKFTNREP
ncbi:ATP-binding protein [Microbacterium aurum]